MKAIDNKSTVASNPCLTHTLMQHSSSIQANSMGLHSAHTRNGGMTWLLLLGKSPFRTATISSRHSALVVSYSAGAGWSMPLHLGLPKLREATNSSSAPQAGKDHKNMHICSSTDA